ncbi:AAA family ATPase [Roseibium sp. RKSG952]|uniref:AAA family ATPase n=1 Tax=Roseibium sp. RKSG952 TaxID=2529384 RepID=UPI0012BB992E|nr:AAA family ATPase [Roseibium sp. RKSG952]MTH96772.1 DNA topology modulation protein FlaR [Roseibium sp. RKSG952]
MKRVMIAGGPGSGKSTLARLLGERTGLPVFHMDHIHWLSGWVERSRDEKDRLTREVHMKERWIFEGGHSRTYAERVARADTFIWLDVPVGLRMARVLRRSARFYGQNRPDLPDGCPERFNARTLEFLRFIWRTRHSGRAKLEAIYRDPPEHLAPHHLTSLKQTEEFLKNARQT